jgi:glycosyltransferase involved in cell wall biosynthesis
VIEEHQGAQSPLVSIGMPVFNGAAVVRNSIESILSQSHENFELIISDNGSTDDTQSICLHYQALDRRIRYFRQPVNLGVMANFMFCLKQSVGEYFMWCAGDDSAGHRYVEHCVASLAGDPAAILVAGLVSYVDRQAGIAEGARTQLVDDRGSTRVLKYFRRVSDNGVFYGVYRRRAISACSIRNIMGGDWLWLAEVAYLGKVRTISSASIRRDNSWAKTNPARYYARLAHAVDAPAFFSRLPRTATALSVGVSMYSRSDVFKTVPRPRRLVLSTLVVLILMIRAASAALKTRARRLAAISGSQRGTRN